MSTMPKALRHPTDATENVIICFYYSFQVHRLVVVNEFDRVEGVVSLSDILAFLVLRPLGEKLGAKFQKQLEKF